MEYDIVSIINVLTAIYTLLSIVARLTPTDKDDKLVAKLGNILDVLTTKKIK